MESCSWVGNLNTIKIQIIPYDRQAPRWPPVTPTSWYSHPCIVLSHTEPGWSMWPPVCGRRDGVPLLRLRGKDCGFCLVHPLSSLLPHFILFFLFFIFLAVLVFVAACRLFLSCGERGLLFVAVHGLLIAVASLAAEHGLQACRLQQLWHAGSVVVARGLSSCGAWAQSLRGMWDLPGPGSNPCPLHWQADS